MAKKTKDSCCTTSSCCKVDSVISIDDRGQMVLPKELRKKAGIKPGDKMAVATWEKDGKICCITLVKTDELAKLLKSTLGPVLKEVL